MKARTIIEVIASLLIICFLYAAISQAVFHNTFQSQINRSLVNEPLTVTISWLLPAVQLLLSFLLYRPATRLAGLCCSLALVGCYTVYLITMLPQTYSSACHCGEPWQGFTVEVNILVNLAIILLAATAIILTGRFKTDSPGFS